ncbi:MAG: RagB/SusD family nutrient uptake outer membrane protein, partial [Bacteroidales bacterium 45-6]
MLSAILFSGCTSFLDKTPQGILTDEEINSPQYVDNLVTSAYAIWVSGDDINSSFSLWNYDVRSDDCYKGGSGAADGDVFHFLEIAQGTNTTDWNINDIWVRLYKCVTRANTALKSLDQLNEVAYPMKKTRIAEMRFLRGHAFFLLKELFNRIVIVDETIDPEKFTTLSNVTYTSDEQWQKIADDFKYAYENLPSKQEQVGRPSKAAAAAYLAKTMLYKAYRQDNAHNVTEINSNDLESVLTYTDDAIMTASGFGLESDYAMNFLPEDENGKESIWAIQYSINDGTFYGNLNFGMMLTVPQYFGCCDFHKPSQNLVNAFKTRNGLPEFDSYNKDEYQSSSDESDPRLFHTVAMPGFPYKYNSNYIFEESWSRNPTFYGVYASLKENVDPGCPCLKKVSGTFWANSMNHIVIRYADVLLMRAEALIELNRANEALPLINKVRTRAAASTNYIKSYAPNLKISTYVDGQNCSWTQDYARQ